MFDVAGTDLAPGCFGVFVTSGALFLEIRFAGTAIQAAVCDEVGVGDNFFHTFVFDYFLINLSATKIQKKR
jgi:hypothetical protein